MNSNKLHILFLFLIFGFQFCSKKSISINNISNDTVQINTDWEGGNGLYNEPYRDSILFNSNRHLSSYFPQTVHMMYKDGSGMHEKINMRMTFNACWSPRKWKIFYIGYTGLWTEPRLYVMNADGSNNKKFSLGDEYIIAVACSPDGKKIAYISGYNTSLATLKLMNPDGTNSHSITDSIDVGFFHTIAWSPDSKHIAFDGYFSYRIGIVDTNGSNYKELIQYGGECWEPAWSPDGKSIAFVVAASSNNSRPTGIYLYDVTTKNISPLTNIIEDVYSPCWSQDGEHLVFTVRDTLSKDHLYTINKDGNGLKQLTSDTTHKYSDWSPKW